MGRTSGLLGAIISISALAAGCSGTGDGSYAGEDPGDLGQEFSTTPGEPNHEAITAAALSFLRQEVLVALQAANVATDVEFFLVNANHFDDCNFRGGSEVVRKSEAEAVAALGSSSSPAEADAAALRAFGRAIHAVQDFYAHSNWVELGGNVLLDSSLGAFPLLSPYAAVPSTGFVVVQGKPPKKLAVTRDDDAAYPESAVVSVKGGGPRPPRASSLGLISGTVDYEAGDFCPPSVTMTHEELNKDKSTLIERSAQHEAAKTLAIQQTAHEWCRLRALTEQAGGPASVARLDAWIADGATAPACAGP